MESEWVLDPPQDPGESRGVRNELCWHGIDSVTELARGLPIPDIKTVGASHALQGRGVIDAQCGEIGVRVLDTTCRQKIGAS
jgi:hypothetical protein